MQMGSVVFGAADYCFCLGTGGSGLLGGAGARLASIRAAAGKAEYSRPGSGGNEIMTEGIVRYGLFCRWCSCVVAIGGGEQTDAIATMVDRQSGVACRAEVFAVLDGGYGA
jgi:hypothetical protein